MVSVISKIGCKIISKRILHRAEGYCRRSINEYLQFLNIALGSTGELMTRIIGLKSIEQIKDETFNEFDKLHYLVENKLLSLIRSLQLKRKEGDWDQEIH